tara:strand:+ start:95 stop:370 length:276 start_codon:yes stop_codon:yes gene_type:complete
MLKVNNRNLDPLWKKIPCKCDKSDIEKSYPLIDCIHCNCEKADNSIPDKSFTITENIYDKNGKFKETRQREITEITLTNCEKYGSCLGWGY